LIVKSKTPRSFSEFKEQGRMMEYYGSAKFGWGVAWLESGRVRRYRSLGQLADDPKDANFLNDVKSTHFLMHFRRPSKLSTVQIEDTQPFLNDEETIAFVHNGYFANEAEYRPTYADRCRGAADSEIGFLMFQDLVVAGVPMDEAMQVVYSKLGGSANLAALDSDGVVALYSNNHGNRLWTFRVDDAVIAATQLHSSDNSLFDLVFPNSSERSIVEGRATL
jgi:glutamine phosphoribosylpyrophosphate amidotransferase